MTTAQPVLAAPGRLKTYASFVRFEHTLFSLPLILAGMFSAPGPALPLARWLLTAVAAVGARTAAMALNRLIDRRLDALNPRTRTRELPSGRMKLVEAWTLLVVSSAAYVAACAALGPWFLRIAPIPLVVFAAYPYLKRFTPLCHFGVGVALALAPLAGFAAAHPDLASPWPAVALSLFALLWVSGFDIIYATLDEQFDRAHGVHSLVASLGRERALRVADWLHVIAPLPLLGMTVLLVAPNLHGWSGAWRALPPLAVLGVIKVLLHFEMKWAHDVNLAFFKVNVWVGFAVLVLVMTTRALFGGF
jgi:4-hydroxybenzoate polyprenyltransferase